MGVYFVHITLFSHAGSHTGIATVHNMCMLLLHVYMQLATCMSAS